MEKRKVVTTATVYTVLGVMFMCFCMPAMAVGFDPNWILEQIRGVVLVVTVGLAIMFYVQKATAKMIITIVVGGLLYMLCTNTEPMLQNIGESVNSILGLE